MTTMRSIGVALGGLLTTACVLPPASAGDDDDGSDTEAALTDGPATTHDPDPGMTSMAVTGAEDDSTDGGSTDDDSGDYDSGGVDMGGGDPECTGLGPAGLPGVNPGALWVPTHGEQNDGALLKIDTETMQTIARYATRDAGSTFPEGVSVSLSGNAVAIDLPALGEVPLAAGLTKFYGRSEDCVDGDGDGVITTSSGDLLPWSDEECRAWHLTLDVDDPFGVVWTPGTLDQEACAYTDGDVWAVGSVFGGGTPKALLVDGDTGTIIDFAELPPIPPPIYGVYFDPAVDAEGNLWAIRKHEGDATLVRVDRQTLDVQSWPSLGDVQGLTVGHSGYVWTCGEDISRFDPLAGVWDVAVGVGGTAGCIEDTAGRLWTPIFDFATPLVALDVETLAVVESAATGVFITGIALDFDDHLWGLAYDEAYRLELGTGAQQSFGSLSQARVRSFDMTGYALASVVAGAQSP
jgi:hypothetical protein